MHPLHSVEKNSFIKTCRRWAGGTWSLPWILQSREKGKSYHTSQEVLGNLCYLSLWSPVNEMNIHLVFAPSYNEGWEMLCLNMLYCWLRFPPALHLLPLFLLFPCLIVLLKCYLSGMSRKSTQHGQQIFKLKQVPLSVVLDCQIKGHSCLSKTYQEVQVCIDHLCSIFWELSSILGHWLVGL